MFLVFFKEIFSISKRYGFVLVKGEIWFFLVEERYRVLSDMV